MPCPSYLPWLHLPNGIWRWVQIMKLLIVHLPLFSCHITPHRSEYASQNPVLKHPLPLAWENKFHTHTSNRQYYGFVYVNLYIPGQQAGWQKSSLCHLYHKLYVGNNSQHATHVAVWMVVKKYNLWSNNALIHVNTNWGLNKRKMISTSCGCYCFKGNVGFIYRGRMLGWEEGENEKVFSSVLVTPWLAACSE
jgi:hypothetical protein